MGRELLDHYQGILGPDRSCSSSSALAAVRTEPEQRALGLHRGFLLLPIAYGLINRRKVMAVTSIAAPYVWILHKLELPIGYTRYRRAVAQFMLKHAL